MEYFYREMRRKTGFMMEGDEPAGGKWNYDHDNRKPAQADMLRSAPMPFTPDEITEEVLDLVERRFDDNFGTLRPFHFGDARGRRCGARSFRAHHLPGFGDYQDAMLTGEPFLNHSLLSPYLNLGLLGPLEVCQRVEAEWQAGDAPINAAEGYIRQIIGWREYMRGIYFREGPDYTRATRWAMTARCRRCIWGGETQMNCCWPCRRADPR